jgi:O-methyltransferase involved in polyketide biosynthesis
MRGCLWRTRGVHVYLRPAQVRRFIERLRQVAQRLLAVHLNDENWRQRAPCGALADKESGKREKKKRMKKETREAVGSMGCAGVGRGLAGFCHEARRCGGAF